MTTSVMLEQIAGALAVKADQTAAELVDVLSRLGVETTKGEVNSSLYAARDRFWTDGVTPPRWRLVARNDAVQVPDVAQQPQKSKNSESSRVDLYAWQNEALVAWRQRDRLGVVEAVTGTGKTMVGLAAAQESLADGGKVQIIVPTVELLRQWQAEVKKRIPSARIGQLGDGRHDSWSSCDVLVSTVHSASAYDPGLAPRASLLIADECHRYGSESFAEALDTRFKRRLGLSATYLRLDSGNADFLDPYFGETCFRMDYRRAIADDVTAHFKVALVGVQFSPSERVAYDRANKEAGEAQRWLIDTGMVRSEPFGDFMKDVVKLSEGQHGRATWKARLFLKQFAERRRILAETSAKRRQLGQLIPALAAADRSIVFTQTIEAAEDAVALLSREDLTAAAIHSGMDASERRSTLGRFADGRLSVIAAPQVLDEGIDVPAADLAVIVAASKTKRQMIQRMGRVLRRKPDGRLARFVVLYVEHTSEDPAMGAHGDFLDEILNVADDARIFHHNRPPREICSYLNDWTALGDHPRQASPALRELAAVPPSGRPADDIPGPAARSASRSMTSKRAKRLLKVSGKAGLSQARRAEYNARLFKLGEFSDEVLTDALSVCTDARDLENVVRGRKRSNGTGSRTRAPLRTVSLDTSPPKSKGGSKTVSMTDERLAGLLDAYRQAHGDRLTERFLPDLKTLFRKLAAWSDRGLMAAIEASSDPREIEHKAKTVSSPRRGQTAATVTRSSARSNAVARVPVETRFQVAVLPRRRSARGAAAGEKPLYRGVGPEARYCTAGCGLLLENCRC